MISERTVIVLAAGEGTRMSSDLPKALHPLLGRTLLGHVLTATAALEPARTVVVVGHGADRVGAHVSQVAPEAVVALQEDQRGTGHAARVALQAAGSPTGTVVVVNADVPLLRPESLAEFVATHERAGSAASVLSAVLADPAGLGRIIRRPGTGELDAIVEERDASPAEQDIREINGGVYAFDGALLGQVLSKLTTHNDQREEYLTDAIGLLVDSGHRVAARPAADPAEVLGCNDRVELAVLHARLRDRVNTAWMRAGVTIIDPATTWIDVTVTLGRDCVVEPNTQLRGRTQVGERAVVGPDTTLVDVTARDGVRILRTHAVQAVIGPDAVVGPYAYLRPGTVLHPRSKIGTFVEVKNSEVGAGTKIPHLSYVGDATIGEQTNIGAANVVVNYDGVAKHRTVIGSHVKTGSDTMLVAPVTVGDGAYTGAGTVVRRDVPPGALSYSQAPQRIIDGWVASHRAGTDAAQAAAAARAPGPPATPGRPGPPGPPATPATPGPPATPATRVVDRPAPDATGPSPLVSPGEQAEGAGEGPPARGDTAPE